ILTPNETGGHSARQFDADCPLSHDYFAAVTCAGAAFTSVFKTLAASFAQNSHSSAAAGALTAASTCFASFTGSAAAAFFRGATLKSTVALPFFTSTSFSCTSAGSCQQIRVYLPSLSPGILNVPSSPVTAK